MNLIVTLLTGVVGSKFLKLTHDWFGNSYEENDGKKKTAHIDMSLSTVNVATSIKYILLTCASANTLLVRQFR